MKVEKAIEALSLAIFESRKRYNYLVEKGDKRIPDDMRYYTYTILNFKKPEKITYSSGDFLIKENTKSGVTIRIPIDEIDSFYKDLLLVKETYMKSKSEEDIETKLSEVYKNFTSISK